MNGAEKNEKHDRAGVERTSVASYALISRDKRDNSGGSTREWLLQWNSKWKAMNLIAGHQEEMDSNELACIIREVHEELFDDLSEDERAKMNRAVSGDNRKYKRKISHWEDPYIEEVTLITGDPIEYVAFSKSKNCLTKYRFHVYDVKLRKDKKTALCNKGQGKKTLNEWANRQEIANGRTAVGTAISDTVRKIMDILKLQQDDKIQNS